MWVSVNGLYSYTLLSSLTSFEYKEDADIVCSNDVQLVWVAFNEEHELIPVTNQHELVFFEKCKML